jgi:phosphomannomutase
MDYLLKQEDSSSIIFGGEGSCGGIMIPQFNNTRDGIFAAVKIVEILVETNEKISRLVSNFPKFYAFREYINTEGEDQEKLINQLKTNLISDGENVNQIGMDLRFGQGKDWFVLIHPSNTESIIRIICEANNEKYAKNKLITISERVKSTILSNK